jgi:hypothetical protein
LPRRSSAGSNTTLRRGPSMGATVHEAVCSVSGLGHNA